MASGKMKHFWASFLSSMFAREPAAHTRCRRHGWEAVPILHKERARPFSVP